VSLAQIYPVPCERHLFWALGPTYGLVVYGLWRLAGVPTGAMAVALGLILIPVARNHLGWTKYMLRQPAEELVQPPLLAGMRVEPAQVEFWAELEAIFARWERVRPEGGAVLFGKDALWLTLAHNRDNPGPYFVTWQGLIPAEARGERWSWILSQRPLLVVEPDMEKRLGFFRSKQGYVEVAVLRKRGLRFWAPQEWAAQMIGDGVRAESKTRQP
jgi:hypothetical protein